MIAPVLDKRLDDFTEHVDGRERRVDMLGHLPAVVFEQRARLVLVGLETVLDHFFVGVVEPVVPQSAALETIDQFGAVRTGQVENPPHPHRVLQHLGLVEVARDAVEHEEVVVGMEGVCLDALFDADFPQLNGDLVGHEFAAAGIFEKLPPEGSAQIQSTEDIAAGAMEIPRHLAEGSSLGSFAAAGGAENQIGLVFAHEGLPNDVVS